LAEQPVERPPRGRRLRRLLLVLVLLVPVGLGAYVAGVHLWAEYQLRAARLDLERRDFAAARQRLAFFRKVRPQNRDACLLAAQAARRVRDYAEAERLLETYRDLGGAPEAAFLEADLARAQRGELAGREGHLWALAQEGRPDAPLILEALAQGYMATFRWGPALSCLQRLLEYRPDDADALVWRGWVWENLQQVPSARDDYRRAVELAPENQEARLRLAEALLQLGEPKGALEHLEWLRPRRPDDAAVLLALARCQRALDRPEEAEGLLDRLLALRPDDAQVLAERGRLALAQGQAEEAEGWLRKAQARAPFERETNYQLALCLRRRGKTKEADECLARLKRIEDDRKRLAELFQEMVAKPRDRALRREAGALLLNNGQDREGLRLLQTVLEEDATDREAHAVLADYYGRTGNRARAERHRRLAR
jgi:tetratricopeptide (TPR) repeat protein